jgi:hypothetical protein
VAGATARFDHLSQVVTVVPAVVASTSMEVAAAKPRVLPRAASPPVATNLHK